MSDDATRGGPCILGMDGGTEGMRVGLFRPDGTPLGFVREPYATDHPEVGWAEQDPRDWWDCTVRGVRKVLRETGVDPRAIAGIALAATSYSLVHTEASGRPLRPAMIWMDVRSAEEARLVELTHDPALKYTGHTGASAEWMLPKALWVKHHERDIHDRTSWIADYVEWIGFRLTGERAASINSAAIRCYHDRLSGGWPVSLFETVGAPEILDKLSPRVLDMGDVVGELTASAAAELGLVPGIPLAQGGADAFVGMIGLGVVRPGALALITGSSHLQLLQTEQPRYTPGLFGSYTDAVIPGQFTVEGGQTSTGSAISWFRRLCSAQARTHGELPSADLLRELSAQAAGIRPGSEGVMALDHWQGNRTPYLDANTRGMFWGISLHHGPEHLFRALIESIAYGTENVISHMRGEGHQIDTVVACGGALNSPTWMQIHADVSGIPIHTTQQPEAVTLGSAILAATGAGLHASVTDAVAAMVRTADVIEPDLERTEEYAFYIDLYRRSFASMRPLMRTSAQHEQKVTDRERGMSCLPTTH